MNSAVGNLLRHVAKDYEKAFKREELHSLLKIPTSLDWGTYLSLSLANKICVNQQPEDLFLDFMSHSQTSQENLRNNVTRFFPSNKNISGLSMFVNSIWDILKDLKYLYISTKIYSKNNLKKLSLWFVFQFLFYFYLFNMTLKQKIVIFYFNKFWENKTKFNSI